MDHALIIERLREKRMEDEQMNTNLLTLQMALLLGGGGGYTFFPAWGGVEDFDIAN